MIVFANTPILAFRSGDLIPGGSPNTVAVLLPDDTVLSVQPDGSYQSRPKAAIGAWESAKKIGDKLVYTPDSKVYVVPFLEGL